MDLNESSIEKTNGKACQMNIADALQIILFGTYQMFDPIMCMG